MMIFCTSRISWNRISDWLPIVFNFGTENWEEQLKKAPCMCSETDLTQEQSYFHPTSRIPNSSLLFAAALSKNGRIAV